MGVQLDSEGWFSVTPEIIADHVADCVVELANSSAFCEQHDIVVLDAFCGCGGNAIAFGKLPSDKIALVVCVDIDRSKLRKAAAHNASLYEFPITNSSLSTAIPCSFLGIVIRTVSVIGQDGPVQTSPPAPLTAPPIPAQTPPPIEPPTEPPNPAAPSTPALTPPPTMPQN
jgi:hypothetical protein